MRNNGFFIQGFTGGPMFPNPDDQNVVTQAIIPGDSRAVSSNAVYNGLVRTKLEMEDLLSNVSYHIVNTPEMNQALDNKVPETVKTEVIMATENMPDEKIESSEIRSLFDE